MKFNFPTYIPYFFFFKFSFYKKRKSTHTNLFFHVTRPPRPISSSVHSGNQPMDPRWMENPLPNSREYVISGGANRQRPLDILYSRRIFPDWPTPFPSEVLSPRNDRAEGREEEHEFPRSSTNFAR